MKDNYFRITIQKLEKQSATIVVTRINNEVGHPESSPDFSVQILIESWDLLRKGEKDAFTGVDSTDILKERADKTEADGEYSMFYDYLYGSTVPVDEEEYSLLETDDEDQLKRNRIVLEEKLGFQIASWGKDDSTRYVVSHPSPSSFKLEAQEVVESETEIDRGVDENDNDYLIYSFSVFEDYYFDHLQEGLTWETSIYPL